MDTKELSITKMQKAMSKIKLEDDCLLIIRRESELAKQASVDSIKEACQDMGFKNIGLIVVDSFANIGKVQPHKLNKLGYFKVGDAAQKFLEKI